MSENKPISPRQSRQKIIKNAARMRIILAPILLLLRCVAWLSRISGLESELYRFVFKVVSIKFNSRMKKAFSCYTPTASDVFVCSYFKAGTNWTMQIAYQIARRGQGEYENIHDVIPWPDAPIKGMAVPLSGNSLLEQSTKELRVIKTHSEAHSVPYIHMKSIGEKFYPGRVSPLSLPKGQMIRSGNKGKSDEILSPRQQERIDAYCHESLQRLGCDFPYNSYYGRL